MNREDESRKKQIKKGFLVETLNSWAEFIDFVKHEKKCWPTLIFRGQANSEWKIYSRLDRLEQKYNKRPNLGGSIPKEFDRPRVDRETHLMRFKELALDKIGKDIKNKDDNIFWTIAQHHGLATPLLDFTYSPFVALFFAFEEEKCWCKEKDNENDIDIFKEPDKRSVFALTSHLVEDFSQPFSAPGYGNYRATSQGGVFLKMPDPKDIYPEKWDLESCIQKKYENETYGEPPNENANPHPNPILKKFEIPNTKEERRKCLLFLDQMNINRATLFPDLDDAAKYVNDLWEINFDKALGYIKQL